MIDIEKTLDISNVKKFAGNDKEKQAIFEKTAYSFLLLEQLDALLANKRYVFKGGTSLLLLFKESSRFSIDVDICMDEAEYANRTELEKTFKKQISKHFVKVELEKYERKHGGRDIKTAHYHFYYNPKYKTNENYVMLDIVYQNNTIQTGYIDVDSDAMLQKDSPNKVKTILIDDLFGDKLVAFAPNTIGVKYNNKNQYNRPKYCEIIKQLYDCAYLTSFVTNINRIKDVYIETANFQIQLENNPNITVEAALLDTINTCKLILSKGRFGNIKLYEQLLSGLAAFNHYVVGQEITEVDLQKYAFRVQIHACKLFRLMETKIQETNKLDYLVSINQTDKKLELFTTENERNEYFKYCIFNS